MISEYHTFEYDWISLEIKVKYSVLIEQKEVREYYNWFEEHSKRPCEDYRRKLTNFHDFAGSARLAHSVVRHREFTFAETRQYHRQKGLCLLVNTNIKDFPG